MKPIRARDGRLIVDQLCQCGHPQSQHSHRLANLPDVMVPVSGHGPCTVKGCSCRRFSFKDFIYKEEGKE